MRIFCLSDFLFACLFFFVFMGRVGKYHSLRLYNMLEDAFITIKSNSPQACQMAYTGLPCGCMMQWDEDETAVVFCSRHTVDYITGKEAIGTCQNDSHAKRQGWQEVACKDDAVKAFILFFL